MRQRAWSEDIRLGIRKIDEEHAVLLNILNSLEDAVAQGKENAIVRKAIDELMLYAYSHFATEEHMLREYGYPDYERHKEIHEAATRKILELADVDEAGSPDVSEVITFLTDWLINHIQGIDKKYVPFLAAKGVA